MLRDAFDRNNLLTYASAISFQLFFALIPLALFGLGLLGGSGLQSAWTSDLAPRLQESTSPAAFQVIDDTVTRVLSSRQVLWVTFGAVLAVWEMSGAVRATMGALNRVYDVSERRGFVRRMVISLALGAAAIALLLAATATVEIAPRLIDGAVVGPTVDLLRWPVAVVVLWGTITLMLRVAPAERRPAGRVTVGSTLVIVAWLGSSAVFAWYLQHVAHYGSIFGALATVVIVLTYLYISTIAFLTGVQIDALVHEHMGDRS